MTAPSGRIYSEPRLELDYVSVSDEQTLEELETIDRPALILLAARVGATRLIDNTIVVPKGAPVPDRLRSSMESDADSLPVPHLTSHICDLTHTPPVSGAKITPVRQQ